jgi:hypothetical protein
MAKLERRFAFYFDIYPTPAPLLLLLLLVGVSTCFIVLQTGKAVLLFLRSGRRGGSDLKSNISSIFGVGTLALFIWKGKSRLANCGREGKKSDLAIN